MLAKIEESMGMWRVQIVERETSLVIAERFFRKGAKREALTWASEQVWLAAKGVRT